MCIIQDNNDDWKREAACMALIYKNATFTISATHCRGSGNTLFSDPNRIIPGEVVAELPNGIPVRLEQHSPHPFQYSSNAPGASDDRVAESLDLYLDPTLNLLVRGWVYQEVLLSPRTLYFLANEIMWRCQEHTVCQCARYDFDEDTAYSPDMKAVTDSTGTHYYSTRGRQQIATRNWANIIRVYSSRQLTYQQDKLPALAGIAEEYGKATGWTYLCGLWKENIQDTLGWYRDSCTTPAAPRPHSSLPSWSWASIASPVEVAEKSAQMVEFESCQITYKNGGNPYFGDVEEAVLNVKGDVFQGKLVPVTGHSGDLSSPQKYGFSMMSRVCKFEEDCIIPETSILVGSDVLCLITKVREFRGTTKSVKGLLLRCVDENAKRYERLGSILVTGNGHRDDWGLNWRTRLKVSKKRLSLI